MTLGEFQFLYIQLISKVIKQQTEKKAKEFEIIYSY